MKNDLEKLAKLIRYYILLSSTTAGSGHPTSSLSAVELMTTLMFGGFFRYDLKHPNNPNNDRLIFSKGHASPLYYALWAAAGAVTESKLKTFRKFSSNLEGHPTIRFPYTEAATGSLGQGLSVGFGMALNAKYLDKLFYKTYVLLGDSEMSEGSVWEAIQLAAHYKLGNLIAFADINRLGQRGVTMYGHNVKKYQKMVGAFDWQTYIIDGHDMNQIASALKKANQSKNKPVMIIAKTFKGKGVSFVENKNGWHGKALNKDDYKKALKEIGKVDKKIRGEILKPADKALPKYKKPKDIPRPSYKIGEKIAVRKAYGQALAYLAQKDKNVIVLDAEVSNSTYSEMVKQNSPKQFFEMYIAEQNMVGAALGLSSRGKIPYVSTFAAFFTRAADQIRMSQYSEANVKFSGSHAGVSIGEDGASQMGLEDIALFRAINESVVLYPSDAVSATKLIEAAAKYKGLVYIRTTRSDTPVLYKNNESFEIGGSKILRKSPKDKVTIVTAGITLHEALAAADELKKEGIYVGVIDLYSLKPLDSQTLKQAARQTKAIITVEDHYLGGGIGEAVATALSGQCKVVSLAVRKVPHSGKPAELLAAQNIDKKAIIKTVKKIIF